MDISNVIWYGKNCYEKKSCNFSSKKSDTFLKAVELVFDIFLFLRVRDMFVVRWARSLFVSKAESFIESDKCFFRMNDIIFQKIYFVTIKMVGTPRHLQCVIVHV